MKNHVLFYLVFLLFTLPGIALAQGETISVSGQVFDDQGEPLPGANVVLKGTSRGVVTGIDGTFSINAPANGTLVFSAVGLGTVEELISNRRTIDVTLSQVASQIDDVVVVGYGVQRRSDLTGAVASVKMEDALKAMPVARVTDALQGRLAGVSIVQQSGAPGSENTIRVRGVNAIEGDGAPLVVIDGFIGGSLASLNPSDIQSIEVLKDASSTAIYGSRGANGVLLVTTKRGEKGAPRVTYNGYVNFKTPATLPTQLSAADNARLQNEYIRESTANGIIVPGPTFTDAQIAELESTGGLNFLNAVFKPMAIEHMHELSISGRGDKSNYLISGSINSNDGIVRNSNALRANYRAKIDTEIKSWLKVGANLWGTYSKSQGPGFGQYQNLLNRALMFPRFLTSDPTVAPTDKGYYDLSREPDPRRKVNEVNTDGYTYTSWLQGYVDVTIIKGLTFRSSGAFTLGNTNTQTYRSRDAYESHPSFNQGVLTQAKVNSSNTFAWLNTNTLSYVKEFNKYHRINATAVFEQSYSNAYSHGGTADNFLPEFEYIGYNNLGLAKNRDASSSRTIITMMSALARVNYVALDRYMITASYRYDGSSRLAVGKQWFGFPSVALGWEAKKESFLQDVNWLNQAKLRLQYGITGNQAVPAYSAYSTVNVTVNEATGQPSYGVQERANPNLGWENTTEYNIGLDFGFLSNRITLTVDGYYKTSKDVILRVALPPTTGFSTELINAATILNQGVEVTIGADPIANEKVRWHTDLTLTYNKGTMERIDGIQNSMKLSGGYEKELYRYIVGERIGTMWGYTIDGVWKTTDANRGTNAPGSYKYKDLNGDGVINDKDQSVIGNGQPIFSWGWNNTVNYAGFDLSLFLIGFHGFDIYNNNNWRGVVDNRIAPNPEFLDRWTPENENTKIPGFVLDNGPGGFLSDKVEKGDFVKIKNITLGYTLPNTLLEKAHIHNFRVYVSLQNPFIFTKYSGLDPEITLKSPLTPGADWGYYPNGRNYLLGVNFTF